MLWEVKIKNTFGGRSARAIHDNVVLMHMDGTYGDPRFKQIAHDIGEAYKTILLPRVRCVGVTFSRSYAPNEVKGNSDAPIPCGLSVSGIRGGAALVDKLPAEGAFCARFEKDSTFGRQGHMDIRGCFTADEQTTGDDLGPATIALLNDDALLTFGPQLLKAFTDREAQMVLPAVNKDNWEGGWRGVKTLEYVGPSEHKMTRNVISIDAANNALFLREAHAIAKKIRHLLALGVLLITGGPALISIVSDIGDLIIKYGITKVIGYVWHYEVLPFIQYALTHQPVKP